MTCNCDKEKSQNTPEEIHKFGPVKCDEKVILVGISPLNVENGELKEGAFDRRRLQKDNPRENDSVCRQSFGSEEELKTQVIDKLLQKDVRVFEGLFMANVANIREICVVETEVRAFCVVDDGMENYKAHAAISFSDIIRGNNEFWVKQQAKRQTSLRAETIGNLTELFSRNPCRMEDAFKKTAT